MKHTHFISEIIDSKNLIQQHLRVMSDMPIEVDIDAARFGQQLVQERDCLIKPL